MDFEKYRKKLLAKEKELLTDLERAGASGREEPEQGARDIVDESIVSERKESLFERVDRDRRLLIEVRDALRRINERTYGRCLDDGEMIDEARLDAVPWTSYCVKHQRSRADGAEDKQVTL